MLPEGISYGGLKSHLHPFSIQRSKCPQSQRTIKLDVSTFTEAKTTNQEGWVSYPRAQLVLIPSWVLVPLHHNAKLKWNQRKEICKLKRNTMRCVKPRRCQSDGCQREGGHCLRPFADPGTCMSGSNELSISLTLTPGERHGLWKTQITECYQQGKFFINTPSPWEKNVRMTKIKTANPMMAPFKNRFID